MRVWVIVGLVLLVLAGPVRAAEDISDRTTAAVRKVLVPHRKAQDGLLTLRDGGIFVQCLSRPSARVWRCEAAGLEGQSWLRYILTAERQQNLIALGFKPDSRFGNFVRDLPRTTPPAALTALLLRVLADGYDVGPADIDSADADWLPTSPCHPRFAPASDGGGAIAIEHLGNKNSIRPGCVVSSNVQSTYDGKNAAALVPGSPAEGEIDLPARYATAMAAQLQRLMIAEQPQHMFVTFGAGLAYTQCKFDPDLKAFYCEAVSPDALGGTFMVRILTPERQRKLADAGFHTPGMVMNYWRFYPVDQYTPDTVARALLAVLHDAYGYGGAPAIAYTSDLSKRAKPLPWGDGGDDTDECGTPICTHQDAWSPEDQSIFEKLMKSASFPGMFTSDDKNAAALVPGTPPEGEIDLPARYAAAMTAQLQRLMIVEDPGDAFVIFEAGLAYTQCKFDPDLKAFYCEAVSPDAQGGAYMARILTPERQRKLANAGFHPPGMSVNYWRNYPVDQYTPDTVARALLAVLHDSYGYGGAPAIAYKTEAVYDAKPL